MTCCSEDDKALTEVKTTTRVMIVGRRCMFVVVGGRIGKRASTQENANF